MPSGPNVMALPGNGKNFDQFRNDDFQCRQYAQSQLGGATPTTAMEDSGVRSAALGTVLGAAAGAAVNGGRGAAVGAGTGLAFGGLAGAGRRPGVRLWRAAPLRLCLHAMHVCAGQPGAVGRRLCQRQPLFVGLCVAGLANPSYVSPSYASPSYPSPPPPPPGPAPAPPPR